jgi:hypothetical protein
MQKGLDPKVQEARERAEAQRQRTITFAAVATAFLDRHASTLAKTADARRTMEVEFVKRLGLPTGDRSRPGGSGCSTGRLRAGGGNSGAQRRYLRLNVSSLK